jgi:hypothetical protein
LCDEWNALLRSWNDPQSHWQPPALKHDPVGREWERICRERAEASRRDEERLIEIKRAEARYSSAVRATIEARAAGR